MIAYKQLGVLCALGVFAFFTAGAHVASASTYTFDIDHCTGGCGSGSLGTLSVSDVTVSGNAEVQVDVQLASGLYFVNTGGSNGLGGSLVFNIAGNPTITDEAMPSGWQLESTDAGSIHMDGFGYFGYGLNCTACGSGASNLASDPSSLTFDLSGNFDAASLADLSTKGNPSVYFGADVYSSITGNTGPIGSLTTASSVPEPSSLAMLGGGLVGVGVFFRRRYANAKAQR